MRADLRWAWEDAATGEKELAIVVDILRGSTTITACLQCGAEAVFPTIELQQAFELAREHDAVLIGERGSLKVEGFDLGNSPAAITEAVVGGKKVVFSSTSFPRAFEAAKRSPMVLVGSMLNVSAVTPFANKLAAEKGYDITYILAGAPDNYAEEDAAFVGVSAGMLSGCSLCEEVRKALHMVEARGMASCVRNSFHGRRLRALGFEADVEFACRQDAYDFLAVGRGDTIFRSAET